MPKNETQTQWQDRMALEVLEVTRSELYLHLRFLSLAIGGLAPTPSAQVRGMGTDGLRLLAEPERLIRVFPKNPVLLNREYLHQLLHCIFRHPFFIADHDRPLWSLACDIAAEWSIDRLDLPCVRRIAGWVRTETYRRLGEVLPAMAAEPIYRRLEEAHLDEKQLLMLQKEFRADDHRFWPKPGDQSPQARQAADQWKNLSQQMQTELETRQKDPGQGGEALAMQVKAANRSRRTYRDFLRRFAVLREELKADPDSFDLGFYAYGLSLYGNLPLIEPLESRESKKIEELALVIDTSYSTSGELVRAFLAETYTLLKGRENFFHRMNLHLIQADNAVRQDILIRNEDELIHAMNHFELRGGGGTDFRPAFAYVDQLCAEKKFSNLRGLLYFTDGMGTYPARRPGYDTAFLFLGERFDDANVPPWAMKVVLDEEEFTGAAARPASALADALAEEDDLYRELNNS